MRPSMKYTGKVLKKTYAPGSKSEREAIMIKTEEGEFLLRRSNGNPFYDEILNNLVGKTIQCSGKRTDLTLIITHWEECSDQ